MDKSQAIHAFWSQFNIPAYDENSVPEDATMPYITYSVSLGSIESILMINGSLWYRSSSWRDISNKADEISQVVQESGYYIQKIDGGYLRIYSGDPFMQRLGEPGDDMTRRMHINLYAEFLTSY